jgi:hypothetical protein
MPKTAAWTRKEGKNPKGGLNAKGVASYRAANPGSKLKMAVTTPPVQTKTRVKTSQTTQKRFALEWVACQARSKHAVSQPVKRWH